MFQLSEDWWIGLDGSYRNRVDQGSLVLWRPERTVWINIWKDDDGRSRHERLDGWAGDRDPRGVELFREDDEGLLRFGYLLEEAEDGGGDKLGLYSFTVGRSSTVQMACYFDLREDSGWATAVSRSLTFGRPVRPITVDEPFGEDGHLVLTSERVIGLEREPVLLAFRLPGTNEQDSGWRFFHGDEDEAYQADPNNVPLCPVSSMLGIDPSLRVILNRPVGTAWVRPDRAGAWSPYFGPLDSPRRTV